MSWETPKTNWTANEYFNRDDALRINRNFKVLSEMSRDVYSQYIDEKGDYPAYCFFYGYKTFEHVYVLWSIHHMNTFQGLSYSDEDFPVGFYNFDQHIRNWLMLLADLYKLSEQNTYHRIYETTDAYGSTSTVYTKTFYGYGLQGVLNDNTEAELYPKVNSGIDRNFCVGSRDLYYQNTYYAYTYNFSDSTALYNQPFLTASELNTIESRMLTVYNRLISYGG